MKKIIIRIAAVLVLLVIVALAVVFFSLNSIVKKGVETVGPQLTKVEVKLGSADISPFSGSGKLSKLFVGNPAGFTTPSAIEMDSIKLGVQIGSVTSDTIIVNEVNIQSPLITFDGGLSGNNLSKIKDNLSSASATSTATNNAPIPAGTKKEKKFIVKEFVLQGAKIKLNITGIGIPITQTISIPDIHLQNLGTAEGGLTAAQLSAKLMEPIYDQIHKSVEGIIASAIGNIGNIGGDLGKKGAGALTNVTDSIGGLFKKK